jgi:hypothetical protein
VPAFSAESPDLEVEGPQINVQVWLRQAARNAIRAEGGDLAKPVVAKGLIDTGASGTAVRRGLLGPLGLHPVGVTPVLTPTTGSRAVLCPVYAVMLMLPTAWVDTTVIETDLDGQSVDVLIGRDVLRHSVFIYQGHSSQFTISV